jgi:hypothetical protein
MTAIMVSEHSMNDTILAPHGDPVGLTVSIAPWPRRGPPDSTATSGLASRVDASAEKLVLWHARTATDGDPLARLRALMVAALPLLGEADDARLTVDHSGVVLDAVQLAAALDGWTDETVPVHSLIAFDFATQGDPPGARTIGLAALAGQEIVAWPPDESLRLICARMVARLAHDMLLNGPVLTEKRYPAPGTPCGEVTLVPHETPECVVQILL